VRRSSEAVHKTIDFLRSTEFFRSLDDSFLSRVASRCSEYNLRRGEYLYQQGEPGASFYTVMHGRLGIWSGRRRVGEVRVGQSVGEVALLNEGVRPTTVRAERDCKLLRLQRAHFEELFSEHPKELLRLVLGVTDRLVAPARTERKSARSIAIIPLIDHPEVERFCLALQDQLHSRHPSALFPPSDVVPEPGWFDLQEARFETVLFQCNSVLDAWTERCLRQADRVVVLGLAKHPLPVSAAERYWAELPKQPSRNMLVLLGSGKRRGTSRWLVGRPSVGVHHLDWGQAPRRIARFLDGTAVGLVLGGGGARGLAPIGVLRALEEKRIDIDLVCGTSMGGLVAALAATGRSAHRVETDLRWAWNEAGPFLDFTFPLYSVIKGNRMMGRLSRLLGSAYIEDLPMPFFCMSADITHARSVVHDRGPLVQWLAVGMSVPGVAPPFPYNGSLLLDGGLLNNLPVDVAASFDCGKTVAINVDPKDEMAIDMKDFEGSLAQQLWRKVRGKTTAPHIFEILVRVTTLSNAASVGRLRHTIDHYIQPETGRYGLFDFHLADRIIAAGYEAAMAHEF
jgi:predicted acylesterase/phospholipase RssA/CRP-like cAMP-binding protein